MASSFASGAFEIQDKKQRNVKSYADDPFKATQLWYKLIAQLRSNVCLKKRRYMIRQYRDCFTGENAVDVVYVCLQSEQPNCSLLTNEITRTNAVKVCQVLMENEIFEDVGKKSVDTTGKCSFEDSGTKFYQFSLRGKQMEIYSPIRNSKPPPPTDEKIAPQLRSISLNSGLHIPPPDTEDEKVVKRHRSIDLENQSPPRFDNSGNPDCVRDCLSPFQRLRSLSIGSRSSGGRSTPTLASPAGSPVRHPSGDFRCQPIPSFQPTSFRTSIRRRLLDFQSHVSGGGSDNPEVRDAAPSALAGGRTFDVSDAKSGRPNLLHFRKRLSASGSNLSQISVTEDEAPASSVDEDGIWMQVSLSRLLTLIDLSFLDELLPHLHGSLHAGGSTISTAAPPLVCRSPRSGSDAWVRMSEEITQSCCFFLDNPIALSEDDLKVQAFRKVRRYYRSLPQLPIIPAHLNKVFVAVLGLIRSGKFSVAVHTLQLAVLLLPWQQRKELRLLFRFVRLVADDDDRLRLKPQISNLHFMLQQFVPLIIRYDLLAADQAGLLVSFMLQHHEMVFVPPPDLKTEVESIILEKKLNKFTPTRAAKYAYCQRIPRKVYEEQKSTMTQMALTELMNSVLDSTALPLKDKELWLKKFKKSHPDFYHKWYHGEI